MAGSPAMNRLVESLKRLPGIGEKSATRLTFFLLSAPDHVAAELSEAMIRLKRETVLCEGCYDLTDRSPCRLCADDQRDDSVICVVEEPADLNAAVSSTGAITCWVARSRRSRAWGRIICESPNSSAGSGTRSCGR